jgi:hypothetical protein
VALDPSTHDGLAKLTASLKERASSGENLSSTYVMWGFFTAAAMVSAIAVLFTPHADRRISQAMNEPPSAMQQAFPQATQPPASGAVPGAAPMVARVEPPPPPEVDTPSPVEEILLARLKLLEEQLDNVTGSIAKQAAAPPPPPPPPSGVTPSNESKQAKAPPPAPVESDGAEVVVQIPAPVPAQSEQGPVTTASIPSTSFGLDLGSESSFGALRARWEMLRRNNPELARLQPKMSVRDNKGRVELRLIAGPFADASDAARVCAQLFVKGVSCDGSLFDGQRLPQS